MKIDIEDIGTSNAIKWMVCAYQLAVRVGALDRALSQKYDWHAGYYRGQLRAAKCFVAGLTGPEKKQFAACMRQRLDVDRKQH